MSKPLIELITARSIDWEILRVNCGEDFEAQGHKITNNDWIKLLDILGYKVEKQVISDEDMEEGNY